MKAFDDDLRWRVIYHQYLLGSSAQLTANSLFVSKSFVYKIRAIYKRNGNVTRAIRRGKQRLLSARENEILKSMVMTKPELYLDEYKDWLKEITGKQVSISTICRSIIRLGFTYKKLTVIAKQRNEFKRAAFSRSLATISRNMLLFVDETTKDKKRLQRFMGHFFPGHLNTMVGNFVREDRYSVVAALDINGIVATHTVPTAFNTASFNFFMEYFVCPYVGRFALNEPRSVVILDNCRIHDSNKMISLVRDRGGIVLFLPPYSPDFNPIELVFNVAKTYLKRNRHLVSINPKYCLAMAINDVIEHGSEEFFTKCGYVQ
ncbi:uncharacterized protein LOC114518809 [Dendronephthya gigantea]|uniref:uncharacterized protein LOC114518809 n=1 Tax=Dendronephthya gigantea TaxID=151771 RepID=UPI00106CB69B|nr:uncharacterized protein LOC114518809 [Dendronephthya gigantea]